MWSSQATYGGQLSGSESKHFFPQGFKIPTVLGKVITWVSNLVEFFFIRKKCTFGRINHET